MVRSESHGLVLYMMMQMVYRTTIFGLPYLTPPAGLLLDQSISPIITNGEVMKMKTWWKFMIQILQQQMIIAL